jgi:hypothetical protein
MIVSNRVFVIDDLIVRAMSGPDDGRAVERPKTATVHRVLASCRRWLTGEFPGERVVTGGRAFNSGQFHDPAA